MPADVQRTIVEAASYLSRNQNGSTGDSTASSRSAAGTDEVGTAIESLLGARPENADDFRTLLGRAFITEEREGHTETRYRRPTTAGAMMLAGGGVLTGAQATIVNRATLARDEIFANLDPLVPMKLTPDPDLVRDVRALIHDTLDQVVAELGMPGGPNIIRVNQLLEGLAGTGAVASQPTPVDIKHLDGLLERLQVVFGMKRQNISSLDDERTFTSFVAIVSTVAALCFSWTSDRAFLDPLDPASGQPFLGTQLVQIERALAVVGQAVAETRRALDRAEVEEAEQDLPIPSPGVETISIGSVLSWADAFARTAGNRLRHGGQDGIRSFAKEAVQLRQLVDKLSGVLAAEPNAFGLTGRNSRPVMDSLKILSERVGITSDLAARLERRADLMVDHVTLDVHSNRKSATAGSGWKPENNSATIELVGSGFEPSVHVQVAAEQGVFKIGDLKPDSDSTLSVPLNIAGLDPDNIDEITLEQPEDRRCTFVIRPAGPQQQRAGLAEGEHA